METSRSFLNTVILGDCRDALKELPSESVDFVLTDPPYTSSYRPRDGRKVTNDDNSTWLQPAFAQLFRVLKRDSFCVSFYGWPFADRFVSAFRAAGFRPVSHLVFIKRYASFTGYTRAHHEVAYLLAKGSPAKSENPLPDTFRWQYTGNKLHPTQKPVAVLTPLVQSFCPPHGVVLDPFCGSGSSLLAARIADRTFVGIEIEERYVEAATQRLANPSAEDAG